MNIQIRTGEYNNSVYYCCKDICNILCIKQGRSLISKIPAKNKTHIKFLTKKGLQTMGAINITGVKQILSSTRSEVCEELIKYFNIDYDKIIIVECLETTTIKNIKRAFKTFDFIEQKNVKFNDINYRIDLYMPEYKLAIECDENGHSNYKNDNKREERIKNILNCSFIRFNPNDKNFNILDVISDINNYIIKLA